MADVILHHYPLSPFSEKVRAMLGYAGLDWSSVIVPEMPPRPLLAPLAAGYRKIPVVQVGADIFCDTRTIATEIARLSGMPALAMENCSDEVQAFVRRVDLDVFLVCLAAAGGLPLLRNVLKTASLLHLGKLLADRVKMGAKARVKAVGPVRARRLLRAHLDDLDARLLGGDFLFADTPNAADFSAYHSLWFVRDVGERPVVAEYPRVMAWMDRIQAFGQGNRREISAEQALDQALAATPRVLPASCGEQALLGRPVTIAPSDYGREPVAGRLLTQQDDYWVLGCESERVGQTQVFLPRQGYSLRG